MVLPTPDPHCLPLPLTLIDHCHQGPHCSRGSTTAVASAAVESRAAATGAPIVTAAVEIGQLGLNVQIGQLGRLTSISLRPLRNCAGDFQVLFVFSA